MVKKYDRYKPTGINWIGEVPLSWSIVSLKRVFEIQKGRRPEEIFVDTPEAILPYLAMEYLRGQTETPTLIQSDTPGIVEVGEDEILILWDGSKAGEFVISKKGILSSTMAWLKLSNKSFNSSYLHFFLKTSENHIQDNTVGMGIPHVDGNVLRSLPILQPSLDEQAQIVAFMKHQTNIIDQLITKKEKLIELLKEKRQAIINEAVTKGIIPDARMKESGIGLIGMIPDDWNLVNLRYLGGFQNGISQSGDYFGSGDPFISYGDVYKNEVLPETGTGLAMSNPTEKEHYSIMEGDVFFTRTSETVEEIGIAATCFKTIEGAVFSGFLIRMRPLENKLFKGFSKYYFRSFVPRFHFTKEMNLVTRASLSQELLKSLPVCLPPWWVQKEIALYLDEKTTIIDNALNKIGESIEKLKEYRQSLISEAVTGKIDVRNWKPETQNN